MNSLPWVENAPTTSREVKESREKGPEADDDWKLQLIKVDKAQCCALPSFIFFISVASNNQAIVVFLSSNIDSTLLPMPMLR